MWSESFRAVSANGRKWWRRRDGKAFVDCGEIHVEIREDTLKGPFPVVTRVDGLPEVQRFVARPRVEQSATTSEQCAATDYLPSRLVCLRISDKTILQLAAVNIDSRSELVAILGSEEHGGRQEYEIGDIETPQSEASQMESRALLRHVAKTAGDSDENWSCVVCCERLNNESSPLQLPCGHLFHEQCIYRWLMRRNSCPSCRSEISTHDTSSKDCSLLLPELEGLTSSHDGFSDQRSQRPLRNPVLARHRRRMVSMRVDTLVF